MCITFILLRVFKSWLDLNNFAYIFHVVISASTCAVKCLVFWSFSVPSISSLSREPTDVEKMTRAGCGAPRGEAGPAGPRGEAGPPWLVEGFVHLDLGNTFWLSGNVLSKLYPKFSFPRPRSLAGESDSLGQC